MKKSFINILFAVAAVIPASSSCSVLEEDHPFGKFSNNKFFTSEADVESSLKYAYIPINYIEYCGRGSLYIGDGASNVYYGYNKAVNSLLTEWQASPTNDELAMFYKYAYLSQLRVNNVLENMDRVSMSAETRNMFRGEALFLRAFNHFQLVITFGKIPLRLSAVTSMDGVYVNYSSIEEVYNCIIKDLKEAESLMTINKRQGRVDKVAAQAMLSKVYLTLASSKESGSPGYEWVKDAQAMYDECKIWSRKVLYDQSTYYLDPDLANVYDVYHQADGPEHIFITAMNREGTGFEGTFSQLPQLYGINPGNILYISKNLKGTPNADGTVEVMKFFNRTTSGNVWQVFRTDVDFYKSYDKKDLRKKLLVDTIYNEDGSVRCTYKETNIDAADNLTRSFYYPFCRKYTDPESNANRTSANLYLIRFAEVALNYAEACGPTEEGYKWINAVRARAELGPLSNSLSIEDFREAVYQDRTKELVFEGHQLYDLRRWNRVNASYIQTREIQTEYAYFYPTPQREIDLNYGLDK